jgi:hypothetical protein
MIRIFMFLIVCTMMSCGGNEQPEDTVKTTGESDKMAQIPEPPIEEPAAATPFNKEISYESIVFKVTSPGTAAGNIFIVTPSGLTASNEPYTQDINGQVVDIEVGDIDADASPELLVKALDPGTRKGTAYVYSANKRISLSMVNYPDERSNAKLMEGYQGEDDFALIEGTFTRRFPLFEGGKKTGKTRQLQYKLKPGEAMKQLVLEKSYDF